MTTHRVYLTDAMMAELDALERDTLDEHSPANKREFCACLALARPARTGFSVWLTTAAAQYAASETGAFLNTADILRSSGENDPGKRAMARAFEVRADDARAWLRGES